MRKLASIQRVLDIQPVENSDNLEVLTILGWKVVSQKGLHKIGELVCYCEVDSVMPALPEFEFLRTKNFRIKTIRLRGQISQGIVFPLEVVRNMLHLAIDADIRRREESNWMDHEMVTYHRGNFMEDENVTDIMQVTKYEPPLDPQGNPKGNFPSFIPKTDETRIQTLGKLLEKYQNKLFYVTEKLDGSSVTYFYNQGEFGVCSRNLEIERNEANSLWKYAIENDLENRMRELASEFGFFAVQGEHIGPSIQKNKLKLTAQTVCIFSVYSIDFGKYGGYDTFIEITDKLGLKRVPVLAVNVPPPKTIDEAITMATRKSVLTPDVWAEGDVWRTMDSIYDPRHNFVSFKAINPEFLLKHGE